MTYRKDLLWMALPEPGLEHVYIVEEGGSLVANGWVMRAHNQHPFRLQYTLRCTKDFRFQEAFLQLVYPKETTLRVVFDSSQGWLDGTGKALPALAGCQEVDLMATPLTNTLPIRRLGLQEGEKAEFPVAYIAVPELSVVPVLQRYTCLQQLPDGALYLYENLASGYRAKIEVDEEGLVLSYPKQFERLDLEV